jgi:glycerate 2-kinase
MAHATDTKALDAILSRMRQDAREIFQAGLQAADPRDAVRRHCHRQGNRLEIGDKTYDLAATERLLVIGAGKAAAAMAQAMEDLLGDRISDGLICVKYGHASPLKRIDTIEAGHPLPDAKGAAAARRIFSMVQSATEKDLVIVLLSGGGSALLPAPAEGIALEEKQTVSRLLIASGATIHEINAVRKHLSTFKGGRLAQASAPASTVALILSDVVGDDLDVIASGPTVPDASTYEQCRRIIQRYDLAARLPESVITHIRRGAAAQLPETPKPADPYWRHVQNKIIGGNFQALEAASQKAGSLGYRPLILSSRLVGETRVVAQVHGAMAREILATGHPLAAPACLLSGGETTVTVKGKGLGGRNQEFALAAALDIAGAEHTVVLSGGTDGTDGPTDAAGALADHSTVQRAAAAGLDIRGHLDNNDAYPLFQELGDLLITGPTRTNVMDLRVVLVRKGNGYCHETDI